MSAADAFWEDIHGQWLVVDDAARFPSYRPEYLFLQIYEDRGSLMKSTFLPTSKKVTRYVGSTPLRLAVDDVVVFGPKGVKAPVHMPSPKKATFKVPRSTGIAVYPSISLGRDTLH
jgi:hypothetical protein